MSKELRERINQFNKIKYKNDKDNRIIFCTLKPDYPVIGSFDEDGNQTWGVTTAPKDKE
jgi:hypothetical protein